MWEKYIPWKKLKSWSCIGCGSCCRRFRVNLRSYEYARIVGVRPDAVSLDEFGNPYLKMVRRRCVFLRENGVCGLQLLGLKPFYCKIWPFTVFNEPRSRDWRSAIFQYRGEEYYVYLNPYVYICPGINQGISKELPLTIAEVIEIFRNPLKEQKYSTSRLIPQPVTLI